MKKIIGTMTLAACIILIIILSKPKKSDLWHEDEDLDRLRAWVLTLPKTSERADYYE